MTGIWVILGVVAVAALAAWIHAGRRLRRRRRWLARRLTAPQHGAISRHWPLWSHLPADLRARIEGLTLAFLDEKSFEACGGMTAVTADMQLTIAAQACLLVAGRSLDDYQPLRSVLVYPDAFTVKDEWGVEDLRLGESWDAGSIVLAWESVRHADRDPADGLNLVLHEFAHQIDQPQHAGEVLPESEVTPECGLISATLHGAWEEFREIVRRRLPTVIDPYGAESPAEFFAVLTEVFFERPRRLHREDPELYAELRNVYQLDPAAWIAARTRPLASIPET